MESTWDSGGDGGGGWICISWIWTWDDGACCEACEACDWVCMCDVDVDVHTLGDLEDGDGCTNGRRCGLARSVADGNVGCGRAEVWEVMDVNVMAARKTSDEEKERKTRLLACAV